jgi:hypothetical protein
LTEASAFFLIPSRQMPGYIRLGYGRFPPRPFKFIIMRYLHDANEMNAKRAGHVCLSVRLIAWLNSRTARRIWMKFGMDVMPLGTTLKSYFTIFYNR